VRSPGTPPVWFTAVALASLFGASAAAPAAPLQQYQTAIQALRSPANMVFDYIVTRTAPKRVVTEKHRVYRNASGYERNETSAINGASMVPALVQIFNRPAWPYDVTKFHVSPDSYDARYEGMSVVNGRRAYAFAVNSKAGGGFAITALFLDVVHHLPVREMFSVAGGGCEGRGWIDFVPVGPYWMPAGITAMCAAPGSQASSSQTVAAAPAQYRESIHFSNYRFPAAIPADVFRMSPRAAPAGL
jgi:hypothetical protein